MGAAARTREEFAAFVEGKQLPEIKALLANEKFFGEANTAAMQWIAEQEHATARDDFHAMLDSSRRAAQAAASSAHWTACAAVAAAIGALATAVGVLFQVFTVAPTPAAPTVATSSPSSPPAVSAHCPDAAGSASGINRLPATSIEPRRSAMP